MDPLGQSLAAIDEPIYCSPTISQLEAFAHEVVMQPQQQPHNDLYSKLMLGWKSICSRLTASCSGAHCLGSYLVSTGCNDIRVASIDCHMKRTLLI